MHFTTTGSGELVYRIDHEGRIVDVNDVWDQFARINNGIELTGGAVVGRLLNDFVGDSETKYVYDRIIRRAHEVGKVLSIPFRCDSPTCLRWMRMSVAPIGRDTEFRTRVLSVASRRPGALALLEPGGQDLVTCCSWCNRVRSGGAWLAIEDAVVAMRLLERPRVPELTHGICDICQLEVSSSWNPADESCVASRQVVERR